MKIFDEHGKQVGEIERPGPVEQDGVWWEAAEYRQYRAGDYYFAQGCDELKRCQDIANIMSPSSFWIMRPIPTPTDEQLKAVGMKKRDDRPVECKAGDRVWTGFGVATLLCTNDGKERWRNEHRWVLVPVENNEHCDVPKTTYGVRKACQSCGHFSTCTLRPIRDSGCENWIDFLQPPPEIKAQAGTIHMSCFAGLCPACLLPVYHRNGKPGEYDHTCNPTPAPASKEHRTCVGCRNRKAKDECQVCWPSGSSVDINRKYWAGEQAQAPAPKVVKHPDCVGCKHESLPAANRCVNCCYLPGDEEHHHWEEPAPAPKVTEKGWSCSSCRHGTTAICAYALNDLVDCCGKNYERLITAPKITEALNRGAHSAMCKLREVCLSLGMIPSKDKMMEDDMEDFIRAIAQRAGEVRGK